MDASISDHSISVVFYRQTHQLIWSWFFSSGLLDMCQSCFRFFIAYVVIYHLLDVIQSSTWNEWLQGCALLVILKNYTPLSSPLDVCRHCPRQSKGEILCCIVWNAALKGYPLKNWSREQQLPTYRALFRQEGPLQVLLGRALQSNPTQSLIDWGELNHHQ